jgi:parallel beta-helix repeat protein
LKRIYTYLQHSRLLIFFEKIHLKNYCLSSLFAIVFVLFDFHGNSTVYYVSSSGNDENKGTSEDFPWRSLDKVNLFYKLEPGDQILFNRGDEWNGTLIVNTSGTSSNPIVYGAYGTGDKPKIYGSEVIIGWTQHSGNIYKAKFTTEITQIFVDGSKMKPARLTNSGYNTINSVTSQTQFSSDALNADFDYSGARVMLRTENWYSIMQTVTSSGLKSISINSSPAGTIKAKQGFLLMNKLEFLDSPGEWYYDTDADSVYLWTPNGDSPANYKIRGSAIANGFYLSAKSHITIQDINILQQKDSGVKMQIGSTNYITIQRNTITGQEGFGIFSEAGNEFLLIQNNVIDNCNGIGIYTFISNSVIRDNVVTNIGVWETLGLNGTWNNNGGTGMEISGNGNTIEYNQVIGTNYNGIFWRGNSVLQYNIIKDACLMKSDGGGIYTGGNTASGSYVAYNIIDNVVGNKEGGTTGRNLGEGIYLDETSLNITLEHNTVVRCSDSGIALHESENSTVRYNTVMDARYGIHAVRSSGTVKSNINYNIVAANKATDDFEPRQLVARHTTANAIWNNNIYVCPFESDLVFRVSDGSYKNLADWKTFISGDANSTYIGTKLGVGETQEIFYNDTKKTKIFDLGTSIFRDVYGKIVRDTFTLQPFTSKILIGKNFENINQIPATLDQSFNFISPKITNDFIGWVELTAVRQLPYPYFTLFYRKV